MYESPDRREVEEEDYAISVWNAHLLLLLLLLSAFLVLQLPCLGMPI